MQYANHNPNAVRLIVRHSIIGLGIVTLVFLMLLCTSTCCFFVAFSSLKKASSFDTTLFVCLAVVAAFLSARAAFWLLKPIQKPKGIPLDPRFAPALYRSISHIGNEFGKLQIDRVWITGDMNAAVLQRPRWGICGRLQKHLLIGLPLAHSVSAIQLSAILAHEFAHLILQQDNFSARQRYVCSWWFGTTDRICSDIPLIAPLIDLLTEQHILQAMVLYRDEEFAADNIAAQQVGAALVAETLLEVALKEHFLEVSYWHSIMDQSRNSLIPPFLPYHNMGDGVRAGFDRSALASSFIQKLSLASGTGSSPSSHPSLNERLQALGFTITDITTTSTLTPSAAQRYLSHLLPRLSETFDRAWWNDIHQAWQDSYYIAHRSTKQSDQ